MVPAFMDFITPLEDGLIGNKRQGIWRQLLKVCQGVILQITAMCSHVSAEYLEGKTIHIDRCGEQFQCMPIQD